MSKKKDGKKKQAEDAPAERPNAIRLASHPRANASIRRIRGIAGLAGVVLVLLACMSSHVPLADALLRALVGGVVAHFAAWGIAVYVWRKLAVAEVEAARELYEHRALTGEKNR